MRWFKMKMICALIVFLFVTLINCRGGLSDQGGSLTSNQSKERSIKAALDLRIKQNISIIGQQDKKRIFDCLDDRRTPHPQPFRKYDRINFFNSAQQADEKNGFMLSNGWPMLLSIHNYQNYQGERSKVFVTFRGMEWGIHKTPMSYHLVNILKKRYPNDILLMPDSYLFVDEKKNDIYTDKLMAVCHSRTYRGQRRVSQYWPGFDNNHSWRLIDRLFPENSQIYLIGWSNGSFPRSQFIETKQVDDEPVNFKNVENLQWFLEEYKNRFKFLSSEHKRIRGIVDIETNYSDKKPLWNLAKYLDEVVQESDKVFYYGSCSLSMSNVKNYVKLIQLFDLKGSEQENGVIRYANAKGNIIIDILPLTYRPYYRKGRVNLQSQTEFIKAPKIKRRLRRNHNQMVGYSLEEMIKIIEQPQLSVAKKGPI